MSSALQFLRKGFQELESVPKQELDDIFNEVRRLKINQSASYEDVFELTTKTSHFYGHICMYLGLAFNVKSSKAREMERRKAQLAAELQLKSTALNQACALDEHYMTLWREHDEAEALEKFLWGVKDKLSMDHYLVRGQLERFPSSHHQRLFHGT